MVQISYNPLVVYAPIWAFFLLAVYAISCIGIGLASLRDTPEAAAEIERQVEEARAAMKARGIIKRKEL